MRIHFASGQNMFRLQMQNPLQNTMGQVQNAGLQKIIQQISIMATRKTVIRLN